MVPSASVPDPESVTELAGRLMLWSVPALAVGAWLLPWESSSQLMFQPADEVAASLSVCGPAVRFTVTFTVCQVCHPPVEGRVTDASTVAPFFTWRVTLLNGVATLSFKV